MRVSTYIEMKLKEKGITKKELYQMMVDNFYKDETYISEKGFFARFYNKMYADDVINICKIVGIDFNDLVECTTNSRIKINDKKIKYALANSKFISLKDRGFVRWNKVDSDRVFFVWFKGLIASDIEFKVEMYSFKEGLSRDITFLYPNAIIYIDKKWDERDFNSKMEKLVDLNYKIFQEMG